MKQNRETVASDHTLFSIFRELVMIVLSRTSLCETGSVSERSGVVFRLRAALIPGPVPAPLHCTPFRCPHRRSEKPHSSQPSKSSAFFPRREGGSGATPSKASKLRHSRPTRGMSLLWKALRARQVNFFSSHHRFAWMLIALPASQQN